MKNIIKLSFSLFGNQILASVGGGMCIIFVWMLAGGALESWLLFLAITLPFFIYIEYHAAFKYGFHNPDRRNKPNSKSYIFKGAVAGLISVIPLMLLIALYFVFVMQDKIYLSEFARLYSRILSMYYSWPMSNIFPNHTAEVLLSSIVLPIIIPMIGYIAGYKNFYLSDIVFKFLKIKPKV